jgi:hypothetical protein
VEQFLQGAITMEDIACRTDALKSLGTDLGCGGSRKWILLTDYTQRVIDKVPPKHLAR